MNNIVNDYAMFMQNLNLKNMMRKKARKDKNKTNLHFFINTNFILTPSLLIDIYRFYI